jgi:hypothetical protein
MELNWSVFLKVAFGFQRHWLVFQSYWIGFFQDYRIKKEVEWYWILIGFFQGVASVFSVILGVNQLLEQK